MKRVNVLQSTMIPPLYLSLLESEFLLSVTELLLHLRLSPHRQSWLCFLRHQTPPHHKVLALVAAI